MRHFNGCFREQGYGAPVCCIPVCSGHARAHARLTADRTHAHKAIRQRTVWQQARADGLLGVGVGLKRGLQLRIRKEGLMQRHVPHVRVQLRRAPGTPGILPHPQPPPHLDVSRRHSRHLQHTGCIGGVECIQMVNTKHSNPTAICHVCSLMCRYPAREPPEAYGQNTGLDFCLQRSPPSVPVRYTVHTPARRAHRTPLSLISSHVARCHGMCTIKMLAWCVAWGKKLEKL